MLFQLESTAGATQTPAQRVRPTLGRADAALRDAFPRIERGMDYPFASGGDWSTHDLLFHLLQIIGPAALTAATWSVAEHAAQKLIAALDEGSLTDIKFLVDWRVQVRTPGFMTLAKRHFTDIRVSSTHAKVFVLRNDEWNLSLVGSANLTNNPRIEAGHLSTNPDTANFHADWIEREIQNAAPFGMDMRKRGKKDGRN